MANYESIPCTCIKLCTVKNYNSSFDVFILSMSSVHIYNKPEIHNFWHSKDWLWTEQAYCAYNLMTSIDVHVV